MSVRWKSVPLCEECFIAEEGPISYAGKLPTLVKHPFQLDTSVRKVENCFTCGDTTVVGIYVQRQLEEEDPKDEVLEGGVIMHPRAHLEGPL